MKSNVIFKNDDLEIFWQTGKTPANGDAKGVKIRCKVKNPFDGNIYEKYAGWIGRSLSLHAGINTPCYVVDCACDLINKNKEQILPAIIIFLNKNFYNLRATDFIEDNAEKAGIGIDFKTSHPVGEKERNKVRLMMQKNTSFGTNHL